MTVARDGGGGEANGVVAQGKTVQGAENGKQNNSINKKN
jgi:hypothetical protein